ncbi:MAG: hypothetical protein LBH43_17770 [Treponema sp.]|nr:hypothetical protein [Treponema sp.]
MKNSELCRADNRWGKTMNANNFIQTIDELKDLLRQNGQFETNTRPTSQVEILKETALCCELLYFEDFTFQEGSIAGDIYVTKIKDIFSQPKRKKYHPLNHPGPSVFNVNFKISECTGNEGIYSHKTQTITVHPDFNDFITLMHEMIHAYDDQMTHAQAEILTIMLYNKLKCKIKNLDLVLLAWAQYDNQKMLEQNGEIAHEVLFLLKSLDLELRLELPVGTISGFFSKRKDTLQAPMGKIKIERL